MKFVNNSSSPEGQWVRAHQNDQVFQAHPTVKKKKLIGDKYSHLQLTSSPLSQNEYRELYT